MDNLTIILIVLSILLFISFAVIFMQSKVITEYKELDNTHYLIEEKIYQATKKDHFFAVCDNRVSTIKMLEMIINDIERIRSENIKFRRKVSEEFERKPGEDDDYFIERIVLLTKLIDSSELIADRFNKTKFDSNFVALNGIFYLNYFCKNKKLYRWEIDIQYWDLFKVRCLLCEEIPVDESGKEILLSTNIADVRW